MHSGWWIGRAGGREGGGGQTSEQTNSELSNIHKIYLQNNSTIFIARGARYVNEKEFLFSETAIVNDRIKTKLNIRALSEGDHESLTDSAILKYRSKKVTYNRREMKVSEKVFVETGILIVHRSAREKNVHT